MDFDENEMKTAYIEWHASAKALMAAAEDLLARGGVADKEAFDRLAARWAEAKSRYARFAIDDPQTDWSMTLD